ncbi:MAG TPA: hypothetical protein H9722_00795 [Candidatus Mediterraneibacter pullistercoris]|nr:hypothetical protein [Candidatus Mediterraneibacter pullistercoris]
MREISQYIENEHRSTQNTSTTDELIHVQGERIREDPVEYIARKFNIRGDADGQKHTE